MPLQDGNEIVLVDVNTIELIDVNTIKLFEVILPENFKANGPSIGGSDIKRISRTASTPTINRSRGIN